MRDGREIMIAKIILVTKYINDLLSMVINNKDDEDKLNESLIFFMDEYNGKINRIFNLITEEMERLKYLEGS